MIRQVLSMSSQRLLSMQHVLAGQVTFVGGEGLHAVGVRAVEVFGIPPWCLPGW